MIRIRENVENMLQKDKSLKSIIIWRGIFGLSIAINVVLCVINLTGVKEETSNDMHIDETQTIKKNDGLVVTDSFEGDDEDIEYDFHSNSQYDERVSIFELNHKAAEIVFAGDSLTQKYLLEEFFPDMDILNRGIGSDVSEGLLDRFDEILSHSPSKVFIWIGVNDIAKDIKTQETVSNVKECIELCKASAVDVYILSVCPANEGMDDDVRKLNSMYKELCDENGAVYINLYDSFVDDEGNMKKDYYGVDGVHLNGKGYSVVTAILNDYVYGGCRG